MSVCRVQSSALSGIEGLPVEVEVDVGAGLPWFSIVGQPDAAVQEAYFYMGLTLKETGKAMNFTESRISQLLKRALGKLRERFENSPPVSCGGGWQESLV